MVNVVKQRGNDTGKIFEYSRNLTSIARKIHSNDLVTALIGVGKSTNDVPLSFINYTPPADENYKKVDDYIYSESAFQFFNR